MHFSESASHSFLHTHWPQFATFTLKQTDFLSLSCSVFQCSCTGKVALTTTATTTTTTVGCNTLYLVSTAETFKLSLCVCVWQFHCQLEQMLLPGQFPIWLATQSVARIHWSNHPFMHFFFFLSFFPFAFFLHTSVSPFSWLSLYKGSVMVVVVVVVFQILNGLITTTTTNTSSAVVPTAQNTTTTTTTADLCISGTLACDQVMMMTMMRMMMMRRSLLAQNRQK